MNPNIYVLPAPELCELCCSPNVVLTTNSRIYGQNYGEWPYIYYCEDCQAAVGCHPKTHIPLGRMADREIRRLRAQTHEVFDRLWRERLMSRQEAYSWLAQALNIEVDQCHISWFTRQQLIDAMDVSQRFYRDNYEVLVRRKEKRESKKHERFERDRNQAKRRKRR